MAGISVVAGGLLCYGTGLVGYLSFRGATEGDILDNFTGPLAAFFKIVVILHLVMYIPSEVCPYRLRNILISGVPMLVVRLCSRVPKLDSHDFGKLRRDSHAGWSCFDFLGWCRAPASSIPLACHNNR